MCDAALLARKGIPVDGRVGAQTRTNAAPKVDESSPTVVPEVLKRWLSRSLNGLTPRTGMDGTSTRLTFQQHLA